jgi:hypothetical protein
MPETDSRKREQASPPDEKRRTSGSLVRWRRATAHASSASPEPSAVWGSQLPPDPIYRVPGPASCLEPDRDPAWSQLAGSPINPNRSPSQLAASKRLPTSRPTQRAGHIEVALHRSDQRAAPTRLFKSDRDQHAAQIRKSIRNRASQLPKNRCMTVFEPASWVTGRAGCPISCPRMPIP